MRLSNEEHKLNDSEMQEHFAEYMTPEAEVVAEAEIEVDRTTDQGGLSDEESALFDDLRPNPEAAALQSSMDIASKRNPDQYASDLSLAESQTIPVDTVSRNRDEVSRRAKLAGIDFDDLRANYPRTAKYFSNPDNASVSFDDIDAFKNIEISLQEPERGFWNNTVRGMGHRVNNLTGNLIELAGNIGGNFDDYMHSQGVPNPGIIFGEDGVSWSWDIPEGTPSRIQQIGEAISEGDGAGYVPSFTWNKLKGDITVENLAGYVVEQGAQSLPDMAAMLYTLPAYLASRTEDIAETRTLNSGGDRVSSEELIKSLPTAVAVSLIDLVSTRLMLGIGQPAVKGGKEVVKAAGTAFAFEAATEGVQEVTEYLGETLGTDKKVDIAEMGDRSLAAMVVGGPMGGGIRAASASVEAAQNKMARNTIKKLKSGSDQDSLDRIIAAAAEVKTKDRSGDKYAEFIDEIGSDREIFFQKGALEGLENLPAVITEQLSLDNDNDVVIPLKSFLTDVVVNDELMNVIRPHLRMDVDTLSAVEMEVEQVDVKNLVEKALNEKEKMGETRVIQEELTRQLVETGRVSQKEASFSAALQTAYVVTKAGELGVQPSAVFEKMGLEIVGPGTPGSLAPDQETFEQADIISASQDFGGLVFDDTVEIVETGKRANIRQPVQQLWDQTQGRKDTMRRLIECMG